ncbi:MAG: cation:H+ antiporter [Glaciecola sp.]|jgi:cation:H+ antiporter
MLLPLLGIVVGLVVLTLAADHFVLGAARTSSRLNLSPVVIGAVVIGFGTSAPEMVVSGIAASGGQLDIAVGNVIGSNVANLSLVLGAAALAATITVSSKTLRREAPLSLFSVLLFAVLVRDGLTRTEGYILLGTLVLSLGWILASARREGNEELSEEVAEYLEEGGEVALGRELGRALLGLLGTVAAAQVLVTSATKIASEMGLAEGFVGLTIIAIGTSLPELATSMQAARKGETDLIVGNLLGSNLFNSLAVGGLAAVLGPGQLIDGKLEGLALGLMITIAVLATVFMASGRRVTRNEGVALLAVYVVMVPLLA